MKKARRILADLLERSLNTEQIQYVSREVDPNFNLAEVSGFGHSITIPRKVAAECVNRYFNSDQAILNFIAVMIQREGYGGSGGIITLKGLEPLIQELKIKGFIFDKEKSVFIRDQAHQKTTDWGYLVEGSEYRVSLMSIDIVSSSSLINTNVKVDIESTVRSFREYVTAIIEYHNGRMWAWHGDGGLAAFASDNAPVECIMAGLTMIARLPIYNITKNELRPENLLRIRLAGHTGLVLYHSDTGRIAGDDVERVSKIESESGEPNSFVLSDSIYGVIPPEMQNYFFKRDSDSMGTLYQNYAL